MRIFLACFMAIGCSAGAPTPSGPTQSVLAPGPAGSACAARKGTYLVQYNETSGTCGKLTDQVLVINDEVVAKEVSKCTGGSEASSDNCDIEVDETCPVTDRAANVRTKGKVTWSNDGRVGSGLLQFIVSDQEPGVSCTGVYKVVYVRQ